MNEAEWKESTDAATCYIEEELASPVMYAKPETHHSKEHFTDITLLMYAKEMKQLAEEVASHSKGRVVLSEIVWKRFADGFPNAHIENARSLKWAHVAFLASMHTSAAIFEQLSVIYALPRYLARTLKIILPYFPTATMERIAAPGDVATAHTLARMVSATPSSAKGPAQVIIFDIHTLQNQFYFSDDVMVRLEGCAALLKRQLRTLPGAERVSIAFPDEGAVKRFGRDFSEFDQITCTKMRDGDRRVVRLKEGDVRGRHVVIVDDLIQSGGTMLECAKVIRAAGAADVSAFVTHAIFPGESWRKFLVPDTERGAPGGGLGGGLLRHFWVTNTHPVSAQLVDKPPFHVISIAPLVEQFIDD